jgi:hypothetical protein
MGYVPKEWRGINNFIFFLIFWKFPSGGGGNSPRRAHHLGEREGVECNK